MKPLLADLFLQWCAVAEFTSLEKAELIDENFQLREEIKQQFSDKNIIAVSGAFRRVLDTDAGDFIYIPAGEIHVEANASETIPLVVVLTRNCPDSHVVYLDGGPDGADDVPAPC